ncbi:M3 family metallopeptidase [Micropruina sonneratiae]|uniref:M3 family metallopeptidase n=1 Tax=Micropruina sonneratiae TaxID=2986940 RepID=UPI002225BC2D|nr:M3 family metallopeptidase [Micropruina sp. KQZ13P-5]MCW3159373.1 M3 family metallopeptidase [Micropruina sp. KQZ13P-5]
MRLDPSNPFAAPSALPYQLTPWADVRPEHYLPAADAGIDELLSSLQRLADDPEPPTIGNVIEAWESSSQLLGRVLGAFYTVQPADTTDELDAVETELSPKLARLSDAMYQNRALFERVGALDARVAAGELDATDADRYWIETHLRDFVRAGVSLPEADQARLRELNARLAELTSAFGRTALAGSNAAAVLVTDEAELAGASESTLAGARAAAEGRGLDGWLLELDSCTPQDVLTELDDPALRERVHLASVSRGWQGEHDTRELLVEIARLRAERASLLGYRHHAEYVAADACAKTSEAVREMLHRLVSPAVRNARAEASDLQQLQSEQLRPADWEYRAEQLKAQRYSFDTALLRPYLELERVLHEGVFAAATGLFGITFAERGDLAGYNDEVRVFEVFDADGTGLGLFLADYYTRAGKQGGAWMNNIVDQNHLLGQQPVVVNNLNIVKPPAGRPTLLSWGEVNTMFHEFGHALHGLLSDTRYPSQSGANTPRDFVEFPSQVNELWSFDPGLLRRYAVHHATGEPLPAAWIENLRAAEVFNQGWATTEILAASLLDQAWHSTPLADLPESADEVERFEAQALAAAGVDFPLAPTRYRSTYFKHIFEGGYAAAYYSYLWSEVLDADTSAWFLANGGLTRANGERYRRLLLARGGSIEAMDTFRDFRGADPDISHLLLRRGLAA